MRGCIILDLFNDLPKSNKKVMLRFKGGEEVGRHYEKCKKEIEKQKKIETLNASNMLDNNDKLVETLTTSKLGAPTRKSVVVVGTNLLLEESAKDRNSSVRSSKDKNRSLTKGKTSENLGVNDNSMEEYLSGSKVKRN